MEDRLVTIRTTTFSKAQIIKNRFDQEGIECFLRNIHAIRPTVPGGVNIRIKEEDVAHALRIITSFEEEERRTLETDNEKDKKIEKILVPVDFTNASLKACSYALNLASKFNAKVKLIHIYPSPALDVIPVTESHTIQVNVDIMIREMETNVQKEMDKFVLKVKNEFSGLLEKGIELDYQTFSGEPVIDILDMADSFMPDIIVLGAKSCKEEKNKKLGKFISQIVEFAKTPVLIVPDDTQTKNIHEVKNIVYATDFDETDFNAIRKLMQIINPFKMKIYCIHISEDAENPWELVKIEALEKYFKSSYGESEVECSLIVGTNIIDRLNTFALNHDIGIIALTTHKRNILTRIFNPSTTKIMLHNCNIPLLVFHSLS